MPDTAVLLIVFNRIDTTREVFEAIRLYRPSKLFIAADGPRPDRMGEAEKCRGVREYVVGGVDWPCEVATKFEDANLGCGVAVSSAISWFFEQVAEGIILEDDCVPHPDFFRFCGEMLERFRDDERIMLVSGMNRRSTWSNGDASYFFSNLGGIWGWASWRRAWKEFDLGMSRYDEAAKKKLAYLLGESLAATRISQFDAVANGQVDTWDYQWGFARHINSGLAVVPVRNLVSNIGFGQDATHTSSTPDSDQTAFGLEFPLTHERAIIADADYDASFFGGGEKRSLAERLAGRLKRMLFGRSA